MIILFCILFFASYTIGSTQEHHRFPDRGYSIGMQPIVESRYSDKDRLRFRRRANFDTE